MLCSICLENINKKSNQITKTYCNHTFHKKCLRKWCHINNKYQSGIGTCPLCRKIVCCDFNYKPSIIRIIIHNIYKILTPDIM
jgi:hypothetical protein